MAGFFFTGQEDAALSPETIARRRVLLDALRKDNLSSAPVGHWTQALARVLGSGADMMEERRLNTAETEGVKNANKVVASLLGAGTPSPAPAPTAAGATPPSAPAATSAASGDAPSDQELAIRTIAAETGGNPQETNAIAAVIANRLKSGKWGSTLGDVVLAKNQFEPWNGGPGARNDPMNIDPNSPRYQQASQALAAALSGQDPTNGATHFFAPGAQAALGRAPPSWAQGPGTRIGATAFYAPEGRAQGGPIQVANSALGNGMPVSVPPGAPAGTPPAQINPMPAGDAPAPAATPAQFNVPGQAPNTAMQVFQSLQAQRPQTANTAGVMAALSNPWVAKNPVYAAMLSGIVQKQIARDPLEDMQRKIAIAKGVQELNNPNGQWSVVKDQNGNPVGMMNAKDGKIQSLSGNPNLPAPQPKNDDISNLRKEVHTLPSYKNLAQAAPIYKAMFDTAGTDSKASDLNLVYGLGKIMDPNSVVREGEMVMVKSTAALPDWLIGAVNSLNGGARLTPQTRQAILKEAHNRMQSYKTTFDQDVSQYTGIAQRRGMNLQDVIPSFPEFKPWEPKAATAPAAQPQAPTQGPKPVPVKTPDEARKLPSGTPIILPDGTEGRVP